MDHENLASYYVINFNLMTEYGFNLHDLEHMLPWEWTIYLSLVEKHINEKNEQIQKQKQQLG